MFVCPAVMKDPGRANITFHCVVPQSWGMFPWIRVLNSSKHEHKSNNLRKESANCSYHLHIQCVCGLATILRIVFVNSTHRLVCVCNVDCYSAHYECVCTFYESAPLYVGYPAQLRLEPRTTSRQARTLTSARATTGSITDTAD